MTLTLVKQYVFLFALKIISSFIFCIFCPKKLKKFNKANFNLQKTDRFLIVEVIELCKILFSCKRLFGFSFCKIKFLSRNLTISPLCKSNSWFFLCFKFNQKFCLKIKLHLWKINYISCCFNKSFILSFKFSISNLKTVSCSISFLITKKNSI